MQAGQLRAAAGMLASLPVLSRIVASQGIDAVILWGNGLKMG
jgi:hypothetical protein